METQLKQPHKRQIYRIFLTLFFVFNVCYIFSGQNKITPSDSLSILKVTKSIHEYYKTPAFYKKELPIIKRKIDSLLKSNPDNNFLLLQKATVNDYLAAIAYKKMDINDAFLMLNEAISIKTKLKDTLNLPLSYLELGRLYNSQKEYDKSKEMLLEAKALSQKYQNRHYELVAEIYLSKFKKDKLLDPFDINDQAILINRMDSLIEKSNVFNLNRVKAHAYYVKSQAYKRINKFDKSYECILKSLNLYELELDELGVEKANNSLSSYYRKTGNPEKAITYFKKSILMLEKLQDSIKLKSRYLGLSNAYVQVDNYKAAYEYYLKYKDIDKRLTSLEKIRELAEVESQLIYEKQKAIDSLRFKADETLKIERLERQSQQRFNLLVFIASFILALVIIGYLLFRQRALKAENQLMLKNQRNQELQEKIEQRTKEVSTLVSESVEQLNKKKQLAQNLKQLALKKEGITLQSILTELKADKIDDERSIILKKNIAEISSEYIDKLNEKYPILTKNDIEIMSFIKLGLSQKEIANLRNTSTGAVKKSRYRLRNKLNLPNDQSIDDFINSL